MKHVFALAGLAALANGCAIPPAQVAAGPSPVVCTPPGGSVQHGNGSLVEYLGADPANPELCLSRRGGKPFAGWFGTWAAEWPGSDAAHPALRTVIAGPPGTIASFDTDAGPGLRWHETLINEGLEDIKLLGQVYRTQRLAHEREGFDGNTYHSVVTQWREVASGMVVYQNYRHLAGRPEPGTQWDPLRITEPPQPRS